MIRLFAISVFAITFPLTLAWAQTENQNWAHCLNSDPNTSIKGCTDLIDSRGEYPVDLVTAFNNRGNAYLNKGDYDHAIADYSEAIRLRPADADTFNNRGTAYAGKRDYDHAIEDYSRSIQLRPNFALVLFNRGNAYFSKRDYDLAIEDYSESLRLNPSNARALFDRGIAKQQTMDLPGAAGDITAAKKIDPHIADKALGTGDRDTPIEVTSAEPQQRPQSMPVDTAVIPADCAVLSSGSPTASTQTLSNHDAPLPSYVDESPKQLKKAVPGLRGIVFQADQGVRGGTNSLQSQNEIASILKNTGAVVTTMLREMPSLTAREEIEQLSDSSSDVDNGLPTRNRQLLSDGNAGLSTNAKETPDTVYSYRIIAREDSVLGHVLDEYRTDAHNQPIAGSVNGSGHPYSVGFGITWLIFLPRNFEESHFRLLGQQKTGNRETYVVAFTQIPDRSRLHTIVDTADGRCSTFMQGVAWIDSSTFRIVRMQTDLLSPLHGINIYQLRSTINYNEVKIRQHDLWLPHDIETSWRTAHQTGGDRHRYTNYKLFEATSTIRYSPLL